MATSVQWRRGTTAQHATFTGALGEVTVDTTKKSLVVHDGSTPGGFSVGDTAAAVHSAVSKAAPADADEFGYVDSAASWVLKRISWAEIKTALASIFFPKSGGDLAGSLNFSGTGRRVTADFSNATVGNRTLLQTNVTNTSTTVGAMPNGSGNGAAFWCHGTSDPVNSPIGAVAMNATEMSIGASRIGTGSYLPLAFYTSGVQRLALTTAGDVLAVGGALGYGTGSGGTVTQSTDKSTAVTLNKTAGTITMNAASLAAGATVWFTQNNSLVAAADTVIANATNEAVVNPASYDIDALVGAGVILYAVRNRTAGALSEAVRINFTVHKGSRT